MRSRAHPRGKSLSVKDPRTHVDVILIATGYRLPDASELNGQFIDYGWYRPSIEPSVRMTKSARRILSSIGSCASMRRRASASESPSGFINR